MQIGHGAVYTPSEKERSEACVKRFGAVFSGARRVAPRPGFEPGTHGSTGAVRGRRLGAPRGCLPDGCIVPFIVNDVAMRGPAHRLSMRRRGDRGGIPGGASGQAQRREQKAVTLASAALIRI